MCNYLHGTLDLLSVDVLVCCFGFFLYDAQGRSINPCFTLVLGEVSVNVLGLYLEVEVIDYFFFLTYQEFKVGPQIFPIILRDLPF